MSQIEIKVEKIGRGLSGLEEGVANKAITKTKVSKDSKKVGITTLGCKVNTYESELIGETLKTDDWQVVPNVEKADLYLINTCTVTRKLTAKHAKKCVK